MNNSKITFIVQSAIIAAIYVALTFVFQAFSFGPIQVRIAEALTILPYFTPAAIPGIFIGCLISNFLNGGVLLDVFLGSTSTLLAAYLSYRLRYHKYLVPVPPIVLGILFIPFILAYGYGANLSIPLMMLTVGIGQVISCGVLGILLLNALDKYRHIIFTNNQRSNHDHQKLTK